MGHFTFWISLSLSEIAEHTHRPQGVNYHGYLHVLKFFLLLYLNNKACCRRIDKYITGLQASNYDIFVKMSQLDVCIKPTRLPPYCLRY